MTAHSHACPKCGAGTAPAYPAAYRPAAPRPPEEPERPAWLAALGWAIAVAGCVIFALLFFRVSADVDRHADAEKTEKAEMAREQEHLLKVIDWVQDTSASAPPPGGAGRPAPTTDRAKRVWVIGRMLEDRQAWTWELLKRNGVGGYETPRAWTTARYQANARSYPEVETYLEGRAAAVAEMERSSGTWLEERTAALARESGMPAGEIRDLFPREMLAVPGGEKGVAEAMLEIHRHLVRVDPWVRHDARTQELLLEREADVLRLEKLVSSLNDAVAERNRALAARRAWTITIHSELD